MNESQSAVKGSADNNNCIQFVSVSHWKEQRPLKILTTKFSCMMHLWCCVPRFPRKNFHKDYFYNIYKTQSMIYYMGKTKCLDFSVWKCYFYLT